MSKRKYELLEEQVLDEFSKSIYQEIKDHDYSGDVYIEELLEITRCTLLDIEIAFDCTVTTPEFMPNTKVEKSYVVGFQIATTEYTLDLQLEVKYDTAFSDFTYKLSVLNLIIPQKHAK